MERTRSVLIVEDEALAALALGEHLTGLGFKVVGMAATAQEALKLAAEHKPDLAVLDVRLRGDRDGISVAEALAPTGCRHIFVSAYGDRSTRARALETSPIAFLHKPVSIDTLGKMLLAA